MTPDEERNRAIVRRTLSAISGLYALWSGLVGGLAMLMRDSSPLALDPRFILLHAALLGLSGTMQWKPTRGYLLWTAVAAAGSIAFVVLDLRRGSISAAVLDGLYFVVAGPLLYISRRQA